MGQTQLPSNDWESATVKSAKLQLRLQFALGIRTLFLEKGGGVGWSERARPNFGWMSVLLSGLAPEVLPLLRSSDTWFRKGTCGAVSQSLAFHTDSWPASRLFRASSVT